MLQKMKMASNYFAYLLLHMEAEDIPTGLISL